MAARNRWNLVKAVVDRVGPNAVSDLLELGEILVDLAGIDRNVRTERVLFSPKGRIGDAVKLLAGAERRLRHFDHHAEPRPGRDDRCRCSGEKRGRDAHPLPSTAGMPASIPWKHPRRP